MTSRSSSVRLAPLLRHSAAELLPIALYAIPIDVGLLTSRHCSMKPIVPALWMARVCVVGCYRARGEWQHLPPAEGEATLTRQKRNGRVFDPRQTITIALPSLTNSLIYNMGWQGGKNGHDAGVTPFRLVTKSGHPQISRQGCPCRMTIAGTITADLTVHPADPDAKSDQ